MAGVQLSGLVAGSFNWQSIVDQLVQLDSAPVTKLQAEQKTNNTKIASFATLSTNLDKLQTAAIGLRASGLFTGRTAWLSTAGASWTPVAAANASTGAYTIDVTKLATTASRTGTNNISAKLSATDDVSGLTLATLPVSTAVTAGTFTVDGKPVTVALTDSLQQAFDKISTATGGKVTASYDSATDKVSLTSTDSSEIVLGAGNDTSNFLASLKLSNNGSTTVTSATALGAVAIDAPLASSRLVGALTAVDGSGNGSLAINGVNIAYNINTDSLSTVLARISASSAGVTASYDPADDRVVLTNTATGDTGLGANEATGGLLDALGLTSASTFQHGVNAQFSINGSATISSASNTLSSASLGVPGLSVTVDSVNKQTISVAPNTTAMQTAIQSFIDAYNTTQSYIETQTAITVDPTGTITTGTLANNPEVQSVGDKLRQMAFGAVPGLSGAIKMLDNLGIDFTDPSADTTLTNSSTPASVLAIVDQTKLTNALTNNTKDVAAFFGDAASGFNVQFDSYISTTLSPNGALPNETTTLKKANATAQDQINALNERLANERADLTTAFLAMQSAQSASQSAIQMLNSINGTTTTATSSVATPSVVSSSSSSSSSSTS